MASGMGSLEIARSGLQVSERALYVTGHNISNLGTVGYVRQQAMIMNRVSTKEYGDIQLGAGADIQKIRQIRQSFYDDIFRQENCQLGYWQAKSEAFEEIQIIMGEPMEEGLQNAMNEFWDSWQELSKEPDSLTIKATVRQLGDNLVQIINHIDQQLTKLQRDLDSEIELKVKEVNNITSQIAELNGLIARAEIAGDTANDYRDQRNVLLDQLSFLVNADINETSDGMVSVTVGGYFLVQKDKNLELYAGKVNNDDVYHTPMLVGKDVVIPLEGGYIKGLIDSRGQENYNSKPYNGEEVSTDFSDNSIAQLRMSLNALVSNLFNSVNALHESGMKTINNSTEPGEAFFVKINNDNPMILGNIKLNDNLSNLNNIVSSKDGKTGNNEIALKIANLRYESMVKNSNGVQSMDDYYQSIILGIGAAGSDASTIYKNQLKVVQSTDDARQSIMSVSLDEEMTSMLKYRHAYNASARTLNVIDDMLETIITKIGIAGR